MKKILSKDSLSRTQKKPSTSKRIEGVFVIKCRGTHKGRYKKAS